jgi:hypothetical protein
VDHHRHAVKTGEQSTFKRLDLMDPELFRAGVPHDYFTHLREHDPIAWHDEPTGTGCWLITRFDDVVEVNRSGGVFAARGCLHQEQRDVVGAPVGG